MPKQFFFKSFFTSIDIVVDFLVFKIKPKNVSVKQIKEDYLNIVYQKTALMKQVKIN